MSAATLTVRGWFRVTRRCSRRSGSSVSVRRSPTSYEFVGTRSVLRWRSDRPRDRPHGFNTFRSLPSAKHWMHFATDATVSADIQMVRSRRTVGQALFPTSGRLYRRPLNLVALVDQKLWIFHRDVDTSGNLAEMSNWMSLYRCVEVSVKRRYWHSIDCVLV